MKKLTIIALVVVFTLLLTMSMAMAYDKYVDIEVYGSSADYYANFFNADGLDPRLKDVDAWKYLDGQAVINANRSGEAVAGWGDYRRNVSGQNVHQNFQKNTNSCASCHMTHTAAGEKLLFKAGTYATCAACHDGSGIPFLNVFKPSAEIVAAASRNNTLYDGVANYVGQAVSGTFGVDRTMGASVHLATGDLTLAAAPGGNRIAQRWDGTAEDALHAAQWTSEFTCASCHAPHGSYSYRLMHYSPNRIGSRLPADGGRRVSNLIALAPTDGGGYYYLYPAGTVDPVVVADAVKGPWLYGYVSRTDYSTNYVTVFNGTTYLNPGNYSIKYQDGKLASADYTGLTFSVSPALVVTAPSFATAANLNRISYGAGTGTVAAPSNGLSYNLFCAGCHTDYERALATTAADGGTNSAGELTGIFSKAHRHTTWRGANGGMEVVANGTSNMMCVSCHFTHGADALIMKTADEVVIGSAANAIDAGTASADFLAAIAIHASGVPATGAEYIAQNKDINVSSALKRYTNMSVCWKCHTSSHAELLKNNPYVYEKYTDITTQWHKYYGDTGQYGGFTP